MTDLSVHLNVFLRVHKIQQLWDHNDIRQDFKEKSGKLGKNIPQGSKLSGECLVGAVPSRPLVGTLGR